MPEEYAAFVLQYALENAIVMPRAQVWPMNHEVIKVPGVWDYDHSAGVLFGGLKAIWYDELEQLDLQDIKTRLIQLSAHKLGILSNASSELTEDGPMFESVLTSSLQSAATFFLDQVFLFGDGVGKPQGMLNAGNPALVVVAKDPLTPNYWVDLADILNMYKAQAPACRLRSEWLISDSLVPAIFQLQLVVKDSSGQPVGGSATPLFTPDGKGGGSLLGRPCVFSEKMRSAGSVGDIALICYDQYCVGLRRELNLRKSLEAGFTSDSIYWGLTVRVDGQST